LWLNGGVKLLTSSGSALTVHWGEKTGPHGRAQPIEITAIIGAIYYTSAGINSQANTIPVVKTVRLATLGEHLARVGTARLLVVDDDSLFLQVVSRMLRREGYEVFASGSAHEALQIIRSVGPVDLVLADIVMPGMSGTELVREIAELSPQTPSVLMTAVLIHPSGVPDGVPVLKKPFSKRDLICAVEAAMARSAKAPYPR
jgi:CheY-like chemotaxis protein